MKTLTSGYVQLTVRDRRFLGTWGTLTNIVVHTTALQDAHAGFSVPVNHILRNGAPNKFPAVKFTRRATFLIMDTTLRTPVKPIRLYEANKVDDAEMSEDHFELLLCALIEHGYCTERREYYYEPTYSHL
jgi:hypothetical protein